VSAAHPGGCRFEPHLGHDRTPSYDINTGFSRKRTRQRLDKLRANLHKRAKINNYLELSFHLYLLLSSDILV
jgi:hypothetical protein